MIEKRRSIRVDVNNICEIKMQGVTGFEFCYLKDISILGVGFVSPDKYVEGETAELTIVLDDKVITLAATIIATYYNNGGQNRYGAEITSINPISSKILEEYVTNKVHEEWARKVKELIK